MDIPRPEDDFKLLKLSNSSLCIVSGATDNTGEVGDLSTGVRQLEASTFNY